jgi:hypothetical protein
MQPVRKLLTVLVLALAAGVPAAGSAPRATGSLTFAVQVEFGGGTGIVHSPAALCDTGPDGASFRRISDRIGSFWAPAWSPNGTKLAFAAYDVATHRYSIQITPAGSWKPATLVRSTAQLDAPTWSADGSKIAYASASTKAAGIYSVGSDGKQNRRLYAGSASSPSWSPDGTKIAFAAKGIQVMGADGSDVRTLTADGFEPAWSPNGKRIAYVGTVSQFGNQDVFTMAADGTGSARLTNTSPNEGGVTYIGVPAWSPDGSTIAIRHTVRHDYGKGYYDATDLLFVDPTSGMTVKVDLPLEFGDPAWRTAAPPTSADANKRPCEIVAGNAGAKVKGTSYDDLIVTGTGNDTVDGGAGNDWIETSTGNDRITGGPGRDEIWSGPGTDHELVRDGQRDIVHCGEFRYDVVEADAKDAVLGRCRTIHRG